MHTLSTPTVGSPTARRATAPPLRLAWLLLIALLVLALAAGALVVASRLLGGTELPILQSGAAVLAYDSNGDIFTVRADGTELRQLTSGPGLESHPTWSPDGTRIAYRLLQGGNDALVVVDAGGANPVTLDERDALSDTCDHRWSTTWSPDGSGLIFPVGSSCQGDAFDLFIVPADGSAPATRLVSPGVSSMWATWDPDGTRLAFLGRESGGTDGLYVVEARPAEALAGRLDPLRIGPNLPYDYVDEPSHPQWSPDGSEVAVVNGISGVFAVPTDGSAAHPSSERTVVDDDAHNPTWSPDGTRIAYQRPVDPSEYFNDRPCTVRTWLADPNGTQERQLEELGDGCEGPPQWSPDGTRLASILIVPTDGDPNPALHLGIVTVDGSSPVTVLPGGRSGSWKPVAAPLPLASDFGQGAGPSPSPSPIVWSPSAAQGDWPAPVRVEPVGAPEVVPIRLFLGRDEHHADPVGDVGSADYPWIDITKVRTGEGRVSLELAAPLSPDDAERADRWIAYGLVFDMDRDGVADVRAGVDNLRGRGSRDIDQHWSTVLTTGQTDSRRADGWAFRGPGSPPTGYPSLGQTQLLGRFYAWASVIEGGRVVATDYAPDVGWLDRKLPEGEVQTTMP